MGLQSTEAASLAAPQACLAHDGSTLLSVEEACSRIIEAIRPLSVVRTGLASALGCALADDIVATRPHPPAPAAAMDGSSIRSAPALRFPSQPAIFSRS